MISIDLSTLNSFEKSALQSIVKERDRQKEKWGEQNHDIPTWHEILSEEVGEAAEADLQRRFEGSKKTMEDVRDEYVDAAAVALQIIAYIDRQEQISG